MKPTCKRLLSLVLALTMALSLSIAPVWAAEEADAGEDASLATQGVWWRGTCGKSAQWDTDWNDEEGTCTLIISGTGAVSRDFVCEDKTTEFSFEDRVWRICVEEGITSVPNLCRQFYHCTDLILPGSLGKLEEKRFARSEDEEDDCYALARVTIGEGVTKIGDRAFQGCENLKQVRLPESLSAIPKGLFLDCYRLNDIQIPEGVASIGGNAFASTGLTELVIPGSVKSIGKNTFEGCSSLSSITLKDGLKTIDDEAFLDCGKLKALTVPQSVTSIGPGALGIRDYDSLEDEVERTPGFVLSGWTGSAAEVYALRYGIKFRSIGELSKPSKTSLTSAKAKNGKKMEVKWRKNTGGLGYELQCSTDKKFKKNVKTVKIYYNSTTSKTVSKLKAGKKYFLRIRTSKGSLTSGWSEVKSATAKK